MERTTSSVLKLLPGQFEQIHTILKKYRFDGTLGLYNLDFGNREHFWIVGKTWLIPKIDNKPMTLEFFKEIQSILQDEQSLTVQSIRISGLTFPYLAQQITVTKNGIEGLSMNGH